MIRILLHRVSTTSSCFRAHFSMPYPTSRGSGRGRSVGARGRGTARNSVSRRPRNPQPPQEPAFPMMTAFITSLVSAVSSIMGTSQGSGSGGSGTGGQLGAPAPGRIPPSGSYHQDSGASSIPRLMDLPPPPATEEGPRELRYRGPTPGNTGQGFVVCRRQGWTNLATQTSRRWSTVPT